MPADNFQPSDLINNNVESVDTWLECSQRYSPSECPVSEILSLISHKWAVQIIYFLDQEDVIRFRQLHRLVAPITQKELTKRLRELEQAGLVSRTVYAEVPPRVEYRLTELGKTLVQPLSALAQWAEQNINATKSQ